MLKTKLQRVLIALILLVGFLVLGRIIHFVPRFHLGYQAESILAGATRVETFRVISPIEVGNLNPPRSFPKTAPQVDGCYIAASAKEQGPALAEQISRILHDEQTYTTTTLGCITLPGVVFRIWKGRQSLDVVLCFHCGEMYTVTHDSSGKRHPGIYTLMSGDSRPEFARLAKEAFPHDPEIQAL